MLLLARERNFGFIVIHSAESETKQKPTPQEYRQSLPHTELEGRYLYFHMKTSNSLMPSKSADLERTGIHYLWHRLWDSHDGSQALLTIKILLAASRAEDINKKKAEQERTWQILLIDWSQQTGWFPFGESLNAKGLFRKGFSSASPSSG